MNKEETYQGTRAEETLGKVEWEMTVASTEMVSVSCKPMDSEYILEAEWPGSNCRLFSVRERRLKVAPRFWCEQLEE